MKKLLSLLLIFVLVIGGLVACGGGEEPAVEDGTEGSETDVLTMANVPKLVGIQWFNRMEEGLKRYSEDTGNEVFQTGPTKADAALQVQSIEDVIAQGVDVLTVVPYSPEALEPVLARAREEGIVVISHEASNQENVDYDVEAFNNTEYGAHLMDHLAGFMEEEGEYVIFVGGLTAKTHMEWADGAKTRQLEKYPNMILVTEYIESNEDQQTAQEKMREILKTYPNIKGVIGSAATDVAGAALAIEEANKVEQISVVGTSLVSISQKYLENGSINLISFWDPADAGYAMMSVAEKVANGEKISTGDDLGVTGYDSVVVDGKVIYGKAWIDVTTENMGDYDF